MPDTSQLVSALRAAGEDIPSDTIAVRGYLGPPSDVLRQASKILTAHGKGEIDPAVVQDILDNPSESSPWRIYLSPALDSWVEVEDWQANVAHVVQETAGDRRDAYTVWLKLRRDANNVPIHYRVVTVAPLIARDGFLSGRLVQDFMSQEESTNVVWEEQTYGPTTGKKSNTNCF